MVYLIIRKFVKAIYQPIIAKKIRKNQKYYWKNIHLIIPKGIFHPGYFFSTIFLVKYMLNLQLEGRTVLELGAGNGLLSIVAAKHNAQVTASDVNAFAISTLHENGVANRVTIQLVVSNLFQTMPQVVFDYIFINPPYYAKAITSTAEAAWHCGKNFEYFKELFSTLHPYITTTSKIFMVLSEDCEFEQINLIAKNNQFIFVEMSKTRKLGELFSIYQIRQQYEN